MGGEGPETSREHRCVAHMHQPPTVRVFITYSKHGWTVFMNMSPQVKEAGQRQPGNQQKRLPGPQCSACRVLSPPTLQVAWRAG